MNIDCPECDFNNEVEGDDLPEKCCDSSEFQCKRCDHIFDISWYATVEIR